MTSLEFHWPHFKYLLHLLNNHRSPDYLDLLAAMRVFSHFSDFYGAYAGPGMLVSGSLPLLG